MSGLDVRRTGAAGANRRGTQDPVQLKKKGRGLFKLGRSRPKGAVRSRYAPTNRTQVAVGTGPGRTERNQELSTMMAQVAGGQIEPAAFLHEATARIGGEHGTAIHDHLQNMDAVKEALTTPEGRERVLGLIYEMANAGPDQLGGFSEAQVNMVLSTPYDYSSRTDARNLRRKAKHMEAAVYESAAQELHSKAQAMAAEVAETSRVMDEVQGEMNQWDRTGEALGALEHQSTEAIRKFDAGEPLSHAEKKQIAALHKKLDDLGARLDFENPKFGKLQQTLKTAFDAIIDKMDDLDQEFAGLEKILDKQVEAHTALSSKAAEREEQRGDALRRDSDRSDFSVQRRASLGSRGARELDAINTAMRVVKKEENFVKARAALKADIAAQLREADFDTPGRSVTLALGGGIDNALGGLKLDLKFDLKGYVKDDGNIVLQKGFTFGLGVSTATEGAAGSVTLPIRLFRNTKFRNLDEMAEFLTDKVLSQCKVHNLFDSNFLGMKIDAKDAKAARKAATPEDAAKALRALRKQLNLPSAGTRVHEGANPKIETGGYLGLKMTGRLGLGNVASAKIEGELRAGGKRAVKRVGLDAAMPATPEEAREALKMPAEARYKLPNGGEGTVDGRAEMRAWHAEIKALATSGENPESPALNGHRTKLLEHSRDMMATWEQYTDAVIEADKGDPDAKRLKKELERKMGVAFGMRARWNRPSDRARMRRQMFHTLIGLTTLYQASLTETASPQAKAGLQVMQARLEQLKHPEYALEKKNAGTLSTKKANDGYVTSRRVRGEMMLDVGPTKVGVSYERIDETYWKDSNPDNEGRFQTYRLTFHSGVDLNALTQFLAANQIELGALPTFTGEGQFSITIKAKQTGLMHTPYQVQFVRFEPGVGASFNGGPVSMQALRTGVAAELLGSNTTSYVFNLFHNAMRQEAPANLERNFGAYMDKNHDTLMTMMHAMTENIGERTSVAGPGYEMNQLMETDRLQSGANDWQDTRTHQLLQAIRAELGKEPNHDWGLLKKHFMDLCQHQSTIQYTGDTKPPRG